MSVTPIRWPLSNPAPRPWLITVIVIAVIAWRPLAEAVGVLADAAAVAVLLTVGCGTAAKYSNRSDRACPAAAL
jgi:hypothetical protein